MGNAHPTKRFTSVAPEPEAPPEPNQGCGGFSPSPHRRGGHELGYLAGEGDESGDQGPARRRPTVGKASSARGGTLRAPRFPPGGSVQLHAGQGAAKRDWAAELQTYLAAGEDAEDSGDSSSETTKPAADGWGGAGEPAGSRGKSRGVSLEELLARAESMPMRSEERVREHDRMSRAPTRHASSRLA
ncbi:hypothetical protein T484DRAFT_2020584 [Baffinella frigidus]|nr:hypothetical protein T484DRAFT_2020584 [Cryptophyta sp. CCMP2293]